jgi:hypothetical protein
VGWATGVIFDVFLAGNTTIESAGDRTESDLSELSAALKAAR